MNKFCTEIEPRATKNGAALILTMDSNSATSKTPRTADFIKSNEFDKLTIMFPSALSIIYQWHILLGREAQCESGEMYNFFEY